ncbi:MAG: hypothetical protein PWQ09_1771, partial [Candidatus Cloacimonadota bacterium]|nr:hypothetical protein [Candidatus Cloacimonadota bacterium]
ILKHEARDFYDELKRQRSREVSFSDLSAKQLEQAEKGKNSLNLCFRQYSHGEK